MSDQTSCLASSDISVADVATDMAPVVVGGVLVLFSSFLQHVWTTRKEDRRLRESEKAMRVQHDRDVIADLLTALQRWATAIANLSVAYEAAQNGAKLDAARVREFHQDTDAFWALLTRARLSVRNPAARQTLDALQEQFILMTNHLNLAAAGQTSSKFVADFQDYRTIVGNAKIALEQAALNWDGE
ncbi:hypothetical protein [Jiangella anatolica]|nr:hypothetical protein [Jiangella anatolica]